MNSLLDAKYGL